MKKILSLFALAVMFAVGCDDKPVDTPLIAEGTAGSLTWKLDTEGLLSIEGVGTIPDYTLSDASRAATSTAPWSVHKNSIKQITIGTGVTGIGDYAFYGLPALKSVSVSSSVTYGEDPFGDCPGLNVDPSVIAKGSQGGMKWSLDKNGTLTVSGSEMVSIPNSNRFPWADHSPAIRSVVIKKGILTIPSYAFMYCTTVRSVTLPDGVVSIERSAFQECTALTGIDFPESLRSIGEWSFRDCDALKSVTIADNVKMKTNAFGWCDNLNSLTIAASSTWWAETIQISENEWRTYHHSPFGECPSLSEITITGDGTGGLGDFSFIGSEMIRNNGITTVTVGEGVTSIGNHAFGDQPNLTNVTIGPDVTSIHLAAFVGCDNLRSVVIMATTPPEVLNSSDTFYDDTLYVPAGCVEAYKESFWSRLFLDIVEQR